VTLRVAARSISGYVYEQLQQGPPVQLQVLAVFQNACNLVCSDRRRPHRPVIALVNPALGDGVLSIVLDGTPWAVAALEPGVPGQLDGDVLQVGGLEVDCTQAGVWEPQPDWAYLRSRRAAMEAAFPTLRALALEGGCDASLLALLDETRRRNRPRDASCGAARRCLNPLKQGWIGDMARLHEGVAGLAGLGCGLTPAGDDFLSGASIWAWVAHPTPVPFCESIAIAAAARTTTLSGAFLCAAARGECGPAWQVLLAALAQGNDGAMAQAVKDVLAYGATSGGDTLAGFLWAGTQFSLTG
jgi:hypothetical protein